MTHDTYPEQPRQPSDVVRLREALSVKFSEGVPHRHAPGQGRGEEQIGLIPRREDVMAVLALLWQNVPVSYQLAPQPSDMAWGIRPKENDIARQRLRTDGVFGYRFEMTQKNEVRGITTLLYGRSSVDDEGRQVDELHLRMNGNTATEPLYRHQIRDEAGFTEYLTFSVPTGRSHHSDEILAPGAPEFEAILTLIRNAQATQ